MVQQALMHAERAASFLHNAAQASRAWLAKEDLMMIRAQRAWALPAAIAALLSWMGCATTSDLGSLEQRVAALETRVGTVESSVGALESRIAATDAKADRAVERAAAAEQKAAAAAASADDAARRADAMFKKSVSK